MKPLRETISKIDWNKELEKMERPAKTGAKNGWTLPPHTTFRECHGMIMNKSKEEMDNQFEEHYKISDNYEAVKSELSSGVFKGKWKFLINQCFDNNESGNYQIVIPSLFLILEGAVFDIVKDIVKRDKWKVAFEVTGKQIKTESIKRPVFVSVKDFLFKAYEYVHFEIAVERPPLINRSWVLHGRELTL